ncbi:hypothetical protein [Dactylosporangium sp. NPDC048998]|uniref:hypothetical protein n=1 Tax=Dactylosporangium sp. NPDC048998 TaxID=3363976 RepID=UPI00371BA4B5
MLKRLVVAVLAVFALLAVTGIAPGDSTEATVDHCYDTYDDHTTMQRYSRCTGHWTRLGIRFTGEVYGVDVPSTWQVIPPYPLPDGSHEVTIADSAKHQAAVAIPGAATVTPWLVWTIRIALAALAVLAVIALVRRVRSWRKARESV